ncbi:hypothetical protein SBRCBS47491_009541 [Sporothrix bragantina]|uniref:Zn(2)-C6 fungal-type domain-containing protein n=1 Tax=Sporothrix bragantina TaxID=671064 RepID=A0ABP0CVL2_9PEZI
MTMQPLLPRERGGPGAGTSSTDNYTTSTAASSRRRSRNGCLTCKRRKVRCNEQRPRCSHCQRLRYDCEWRDTVPRASQMSQDAQIPQDSQATEIYSPDARSDSADCTTQQSMGDPGSDHSPSSAGLFDFAQSIVDGTLDLSSFQDIYFPPVNLGDFSASMPMLGVQQQHQQGDPQQQHQQQIQDQQQQQQQQEWLLSAPAPTQSPPEQSIMTIHDLDLSLDLPPILDPIENGPKCASVKALFHRMATASPMFRAALSAFATIQASTTAARVQYKPYYDQAAAALGERVDSGTTSAANDMRHVLATIFFLTYINLLTGQLEMACANLEKAHHVIQLAGGVSSLGHVEQRIVSWIRLLDARAASAGGQGRLVNDTSGIHYALTPSSTSNVGSTSPESGVNTSNSNNIQDEDATDGDADTPRSAQEVVYEMLCQPGIVFYQQVQTITVRITRIAHAHRSRGSVEDETEVMAIAATILKDLAALYAQRPAIMDAAVGESAGSDSLLALLAPPLASAIIRCYQTYLANFYACYIHLHRVAHRHLARSPTVLTAMAKIKSIVHAMADAEGVPENGGGSHIMVNMLWPLFQWGSEENDADECRWILKTIRSLHHLVTNANMTANVLQEIQTRQQEAGGRVDIRSVCLELFNTTFAIV